MKTMGKGSVSSFLTVLLSVGWYALALGLALMVCLVVASLFVDVSGWKVTIPVSFTLDARNYRVTAPSLGIEDAQIVGGPSGFGFENVDTSPSPGAERADRLHVRGSSRFPPRRGALVGNAIVLDGLPLPRSMGARPASGRVPDPPRRATVRASRTRPDPVDRACRHRRRGRAVGDGVLRELTSP